MYVCMVLGMYVCMYVCMVLGWWEAWHFAHNNNSQSVVSLVKG
jgi:hypothetical protein